MSTKHVKLQRMEIWQLPLDLQNLICDFAWKCTVRNAMSSLNTILMLKSLKLPCNFYLDLVWCWHCRTGYTRLQNPLVVFWPIEDFRILFNGERIRAILFQLDFRKRMVKRCGTRANWLENFDNCWTFYAKFGLFYKILKKLPKNPYCPTYTQELTNSGSRFWSAGFPMGLLFPLI